LTILKLPRNSSMHFPKLLVVTEFPPNSPTLTVQCLKGFPTDRIYWWSCTPEITSIYGQRYVRHYRCRLPEILTRPQRYPRLKALLVEQLWLPYAGRHLRKTLEHVSPTQLWLNLYGWTAAAIGRSGIVRLTRAHTTIWDFPDTDEFLRRWGEARCRRVLKWAHSVYREATTCDAVSQPMREELARQTGRLGASLLHSGIEDSDLFRLAEVPKRSKETVRIAYAGSMLAPAAFILFVNGVQRAAKELKRPVSLEFFGNPSQRHNTWFDPSWMHEHGVLEEPSLMEQLRQCTWGFLAMDIDERNPRYNRFSFPNKFGTYLAAGLPLLLLSGPDSSVARMLETQPVGVRLDHARLHSHLVEILSIDDPRSAFLPAIQACARTEFYMPRIRQILWKNLGVDSAA
jgi:hypothetical protein